ncbi:MAG: hypothetical protein K6E29_03440 [Cyanobacteria bacterium RUI128]|nr:hypothetical protein [Cyanobacteria bacterium RUI128]
MKLQNNSFLYGNYTPVSFCAMKKSDFSGIDFAVVEKFKAPIEKFDTNDDFQNWAAEETGKIRKSDLGGRDDVVVNQRHRMKGIWSYEIAAEGAYTPAEQLLILNGVTKSLKANDNTYMSPYNANMLQKTMSEIDDRLKTDRGYQFDFGKLYKDNLKGLYANEVDENYTGWIIIPSRENDRDHFKENVQKLQTISGVHWCTKSTHAKPYLAAGDFHIYFENGDPKIGMRFDDDVVVEIQGALNNDRIEPAYFDVLDKYIEDNDLFLVDKAKTEYNLSKSSKETLDDINKHIGDAIQNKDYQKILDFFKIESKTDKDGLLEISHYKIPEKINLKAIGIDEEDMLKKISRIEGDADFTRLQSSTTGNVVYIGGDANLSGLNMKSLGKIREIRGNADLKYAKLDSMGELLRVGKDLNVDFAEIHDLYPLRYVGGKIHADYFIGNRGVFKSIELMKGES